MFTSRGGFNIIKTVQYTYVFDYKGRPVYNLAFGDYDFRTDTLLDDEISNNGDTYRVFHTVLATVPNFFSSYPNAMMLVRGSDSKEGFKENCRPSCKKNCPPHVCRNAHRRINIYRSYINKNLTELSVDYKFYNGFIIDENQIFMKDYEKSHSYPAIILRKIDRKN